MVAFYRCRAPTRKLPFGVRKEIAHHHLRDCQGALEMQPRQPMATIALLGTMDTKGDEHGFVAEQIERRGHQTLVIDVGTDGTPKLKPGITRERVAEMAGIDLAAIIARHDRGEAVAAMSRAAPIVLSQLFAEGKIQGVISLG